MSQLIRGTSVVGRQAAEWGVRGQGHPGPGGARSGAQAPWDVHRFHRPGGSPPPHLGGRRQLRRRGDGRLLHADRRHPAGRRRLPGRRRRSRHPGGPVPVRPAQGQERRRGRAHRAARRRQVRRRRLQGLRRPARRGRQRGQRAQRAAVIEVDRDGKRYRQEYAKGGKPQGKMEIVGDTPARGRKTGTTITFWPDPDGVRRRGRRVRRPHGAGAPADDGVPQPGPGDRVRRRAPRARADRSRTSTRAASSTSSSTSTPPRSRCSPRSPTSRTSTTTGRRSTSPCSGTPATTRASTATPTTSPPSRVGCTWRASAPRSPRC